MTRPPARRELAALLASLLATLGLVGIFLWQDRASLQRGNRLYRDDQVQMAEQLYRARTESAIAPPTAMYNLGTALFALGAPEAEDYLRIAAQAGDSAAAQRGYYNLGLGFLTQLDETTTPPDSWVPLLAAAVGSNRAALRLDPDDEDARWNLALAQLVLDDLTDVEDSDEIQDEGERPEDEGEGLVIAQPGEDERQPPPEAGREALAGDDPGPLSDEEALTLVEAVSDDPEQLLWGILWSGRPDVAWWAESYPGGSW